MSNQENPCLIPGAMQLESFIYPLIRYQLNLIGKSFKLPRTSNIIKTTLSLRLARNDIALTHITSQIFTTNPELNITGTTNYILYNYKYNSDIFAVPYFKCLQVAIVNISDENIKPVRLYMKIYTLTT